MISKIFFIPQYSLNIEFEKPDYIFFLRNLENSNVQDFTIDVVEDTCQIRL